MYLFCVRVEDYLQLTGARLPLWLPPASRSDINGDTSIDCGCIGNDLTELFDLESELGKSSVQEVFTEPVPDVDDHIGDFLGVQGRLSDLITAPDYLSTNSDGMEHRL